MRRTGTGTGDRRRAILLAVLAGVVAVADASMIIFAVRSPSHPAVAAAPTSSAAVVPAASASSSPSAPAVPTRIPGALLYVDGSGKTVTVRRYAAGTITTATFGTATEYSDDVTSPAPNGRLVATVEGPAVFQDLQGDLVVTEAGGKRRTLAHGVHFGGGTWPVWSADSTTVAIDGKRYTVATGAVSPVLPAAAAGSGYLTWSPSGTWIAYPEAGAIVVSKADGSSARSVTVAGHLPCDGLGENGGCPMAVQSVSDDGRYVALGHQPGDPGHVNHAEAILDTQERKAVTVPGVTAYSHVYFRADGTALITTTAHFYVVDLAWKTLASFTPPKVAGALASYSP